MTQFLATVLFLLTFLGGWFLFKFGVSVWSNKSSQWVDYLLAALMCLLPVGSLSRYFNETRAVSGVAWIFAMVLGWCVYQLFLHYRNGKTRNIYLILLMIMMTVPMILSAYVSFAIR